MPTYTVFTQNGLLESKKQSLAQAITDIHSRITNAQSFFAQVLFSEIPAEDWYLAGKRLKSRHIFLLGHIRAGRTDEVKTMLLHCLRDALVQHGEVEVENAWVYLVEIPAAHMIEYGKILPDPGQEKQWQENLPEFARNLLSEI